MRRPPQKYTLLFVGLLTGIAYGLLTRIAFGERATLASVTYLFVIPAILGIVPLIFASEEQLRSYRNIIFIPWLTLVAFFLTMLLIGLEDFICLLILATPFLMLATLGAFIFRIIQIRKRKNTVRILTILVVPFLLSPLEEIITSPSDSYTITSEIVISAAPATIWNNIVEVPAIRKDEYTAGFFNNIGVPRPVSATVAEKAEGGTRTGNFEGGLRFVETIVTWQPNRTISFDITVDPATIGNRVFDQHVLNGNYFRFEHARYELTDLGDGDVRLSLTSGYRLTSKVNFYGKFWADWILKDFQDRLLAVIKVRCEGQT